MARLTWQNVDAPDFRGAIEGIKVASDLLSQGFNSAQKGLAGWEADKTQDASNRAMLDVLKYQDPAELEAALAAGAIQGGVDPRYMNKDAMAAIMGRQEDLTRQKSNAIALVDDQLKLGQAKVRDKDFQFLNAEENRPIVNAYRAALNNNDGAALKQLQLDHPDFFARANPEVLNAYARDGQNIFAGDLTNADNSTDYKWKVEDRDTADKAQRLYNLTVTSGQGEYLLNTDPDRLIAEYGQRAYDAVLARYTTGAAGGAAGVDAALGGAVGGVSVGAGDGAGTGVGGRNSYDVLLGDQGQGKNAYGFAPPKPITQMTMGELHDYQRNVMIPATRAKGVGKINGKAVGSSAAGAYQIVSTTLAEAAPKVLGENWRSLPFSAENQEKIAQYLFERKPIGSDLHAEWEGLKPGTKKTAGMTWAQVRNQITSVESGGAIGNGRNGQPAAPAFDPRRSATAQAMAARHKISENDLIPLAQEMQKHWNFSGTQDQVAKQLTGKGGTFEGEPSNTILEAIRKLQKNYGVKNPAIAGALLARNKKGYKSYLDRVKDNVPFGLAGGDNASISFDWDRIEQEAGVTKDRKSLIDLAVSVDDTQRAVEETAAADKLAAEQRAAFAAAQQRAAMLGRGVHPLAGQGFNQAVANQAAAHGRGANTLAADQAMDTSATGNNKTRTQQPAKPADNRNGQQRATSAAAQQVQNKADAILRLGGAIRERQAAAFEKQYGISPAAASRNPNGVKAVQAAGTAARKSEARQAINGGPAQIALFRQRYGRHPSEYF
jgi:hypothetical protein